MEHPGDAERKWRMSLFFAWGLGFLLTIVVKLNDIIFRHDLPRHVPYKLAKSRNSTKALKKII